MKRPIIDACQKLPVVYRQKSVSEWCRCVEFVCWDRTTDTRMHSWHANC